MSASWHVLVTMLIVVAVLPDLNEASVCYSDWKRCLPSSSGRTAVSWTKCNDRCQELRHSGGRCVSVPSPCWFVKGNVLRCRCY